MSLLTTGVEVEVDAGFVVVDMVLLDEKLNRGVELLRVELDKDIEVDVTADLLILSVEDVLDRLLVLVEDFAVLEAHAFVLGVYSGPSGGYGLVDAVSEVVAFVVVFELLLDFLEELLVDVTELLLELELDNLLEDLDAETLAVLLVEMLESLLDDLSVELAEVLLDT